MSPLVRSSLPDEIAIWLLARGGVALAFLMRTPSVGGGEAPRFDMSESVECSSLSEIRATRKESSSHVHHGSQESTRPAE